MRFSVVGDQHRKSTLPIKAPDLQPVTVFIDSVGGRVRTSPMTAPAPRKFGRRSVIPGFGITLGVTLTWLALIVLIPLSGLFLKTATLSFDEFSTIVTSRRALKALKLSFGLS